MYVTMYITISKKVVIVNSRYCNRKELWGLSSSGNLFLLALILHNIECRFIIMPRPNSNNLRWHVITYYDCSQISCRFQNRLLTKTTLFEIAVYRYVYICRYVNDSNDDLFL